MVLPGVAPGSKAHFRPDIQGLRAIAVVLVLLYHVWPEVMPGGFVGVDVFFVISGYLITSLLKREFEREGRISFADFYSRRMRRLLPAALVVLLAILFGSWVFLPETQWSSTAKEVIAAALYVENWWLVIQSVDYLALDGAPSPVQHFWSLSIEEQFYLVWPLVMAVAWYVGRPNGTKAVVGVLGTALAASLGYSIWSSLQDNPSAYFSTLTRMWQLGLGAMLAFAPEVRSGKGLAMVVTGLVLVAFSGLWLTGSMPYPGYLALIPTVGAAMALHGGAAGSRAMLTRWLSAKPVEFIGDISYSLYLWHWPLIVFYQAKTGSEPGLMAGLALIAASILLAALSKRYVEDPFRRPGAVRGSWKPVLTGVGASVGVVAVALTIGVGTLNGRASDGVLESSRYPGAMVMTQPGQLVDPVAEDFLPRLAHVEQDVAMAYSQDCIQGIGGTDVKRCVYGNPDAKVRIALVGDSHAVHWLPAFQQLAQTSDVYVEGITKTSCITSGLPVYHQRLTRPYSQCNEWTRNVVDYLRGAGFDMVVLSQSPKHRIAGKEKQSPQSQAGDIARGMAKIWAALEGNTQILVIRPTPWQLTLVRDCVANNVAPYEACVGEESRVLTNNALSVLAKTAGYPLLDFTDMFCRDGRCPPIIGNIFVYRDAHHITASYIRTLAPVLAEKLDLRVTTSAAAAQSVVASDVKFNPSAEDAVADRDDSFDHGCVQPLRGSALKVCRYGARLPDTKLRIAVVGDATGANILPAFKEGAVEAGWRMETYLKESCLWSERQVWNRRLQAPYADCSVWSERVLVELLRSRPDMVVIAQSPIYTDARTRTIDLATPRLLEGIKPLVAQLHDVGIRVAILKSMPVLPQHVPQCLQLQKDPALCGGDRESSIRIGVMDRLADDDAKVGVLDLTEEFCGRSGCEAVSDGVLVYRDAMQPTRTFARKLGPAVHSRVRALLETSPHVP